MNHAVLLQAQKAQSDFQKEEAKRQREWEKL
jgi:hypothetical protein